jgi:hypothetical protein
MSLLILKDTPFVVYTDTYEYKKYKDIDLIKRESDYEKKGLLLLAQSNISHTGFRKTYSYSGSIDKKWKIEQCADLIAGFHIKKPGIKYEISCGNIIVLSGISTGNPVQFGNMFWEQYDNKSICKNFIPYDIPFMNDSLYISVSEETQIEYDFIYVNTSERRYLMKSNIELELFENKYNINKM